MKFKRAEAEDWYYQIDETGDKGQSWNAKNRPGLYQEMLAWVAEGNQIEPQYTATELLEKEAKEKTDALKAQDRICENLLTETDKCMVSDWPYPDDQPIWLAYRAELRLIFGCGEILAIPEKPFP